MSAASQEPITTQRPHRRAAWPRILIVALLGCAAGAGAYTFHFAEGLSYLSNDPRACLNCHVMRDQFDGWQKGAHHAAATCNGCHVPHDLLGKYLTKAEHGWRHSKAFTLQDFHEPIRIKDSSRAIVRDNCVRCHASLVGDIEAHDSSWGAPSDCLHCHADAGHGPRK